MRKDRSSVSVMTVYVAVTVALICGTAIALTAVVASSIPTERSAQSKTPFELQLESAREIRRTLARPIERPEPLPPITAKIARPAAKVAIARTDRPMQASQAVDVFASFDLPRQPSFNGMSFDRHSLR